MQTILYDDASCVSLFLCFCVWCDQRQLFPAVSAGSLQYRLKCLNRQTIHHAARSARPFYQETSCHVRLPLPHSSQMVGAISPVDTSGCRQCVSLQLSSLCSQRFGWRMEDCLGFTAHTNSLTKLKDITLVGSYYWYWKSQFSSLRYSSLTILFSTAQASPASSIYISLFIIIQRSKFSKMGVILWISQQKRPPVHLSGQCVRCVLWSARREFGFFDLRWFGYKDPTIL